MPSQLLPASSTHPVQMTTCSPLSTTWAGLNCSGSDGGKEEMMSNILCAQKKLVRNFIFESDSGCNLCWKLTFLEDLKYALPWCSGFESYFSEVLCQAVFLFLKSHIVFLPEYWKLSPPFFLYISIVFLECLSQYWPLCVVNMKVQVFFYFREEFLIMVLKIPFIFFLCMLAFFFFWLVFCVYCSSLNVFYSFHFCFISSIFLISTHLFSYCTFCGFQLFFLV